MVTTSRARLQRTAGLLAPSIADLIFIALFLLIAFLLPARLLHNGATAFHIKAGQYILDQHIIPKHDVFSFVTPVLPWVAHEWLAEVIMAAVYDRSGFAGIIILYGLILATGFFLLFRMLLEESADLLLPFIITLVAILTCAIHWLARPELFSLLLAILSYRILDAFQYRGRNRLLALPLMMILWANLHGGFIVGLILIGIYLLGNIVWAAAHNPERRAQDWRKSKALALCLAACIVAAIFNPQGIYILFHPFDILSDPYLMSYVSEFLSPNFHQPLVFTFYFLALIILLAFSRVSCNPIEFLLILLFSYMSLYSARYVPLFAMMMAPIALRLARRLWQDLDDPVSRFLKRRSENIHLIEAKLSGHLWPWAVVGLVVLKVYSGNFKVNLDDNLYPIKAVEFLRQEAIGGKMFNNQEFGDYIIFAAWPQYKVFIDSRADMYRSTWLKEYARIANLEFGWQEGLSKLGVTWVIFNAGSKLSARLLERDDWQMIFADRVANIFVKKTPQNEAVIRKYPKVTPVASAAEKSDSKFSQASTNR
jgi:hypothetical protein